MDIRFLPHNSHWEDAGAFSRNDPHLKQLLKQPLVHRSALLGTLPCGQPGIYTVSGGRQIGKTTLLKQWMNELLRQNVRPRSIVYLTGELIDDHHSLVRLCSDILAEMEAESPVYVILDEVTYVRDWDKAVKYLADAGLLENTVLVLSGSDLVIIRDARMRFPGRRGTADQVDFHLYPLNFYETVRLKNLFSAEELHALLRADDQASEVLEVLFAEFDNYLVHGGFLTAINDLAGHKRILPATLMTYSDWIRGDFLKRGKQEHYLRELVGAVIKRYTSQITWHSLVDDLSIDHPQTVADYVALLVSMDAAFVQSALREDKLTAAPKKARKVVFADPFIFHALRAWLYPVTDPYTEQIVPLLADRDWNGKLVESCVVTLFRRHYPTYYIKAKGEVDIAYVDQGRFWPVEVKWTGQLRPKDLKQVALYPNSRILTRSRSRGEIAGRPAEPLPLALLRLG